jgi:hypothetical protein
MNPKTIVKLTNIIGSISILVLLYWIFIFITIEVFEFKIFRENLSETFYLSIIGILSLMFGSLIINVMLNLTRIAEKHNNDAINQSKSNWKNWLFLLSFPIVLGLLWGGRLFDKTRQKRATIRDCSVYY